MIAVTINDQAVSPKLKGFSINWRRGGRAAAQFVLDSDAAEPTVGQLVGIFDNNGDRIWSGAIENVRTKPQTNLRYDVACTSLEFLLDRRDTGAISYHREKFTVDAGADTLNCPGHAFENDYIVVLQQATGTLPAPLAEHTFYWVVNRTADTIQLSQGQSGPPINITDTGTGNHFIWWTAGYILKDLLIRRAAGDNLVYDDIQVGIPLDKQIFDYETLSEAITRLADVCGYHWFIDEQFRVQFGPREYREAFFSLDGTVTHRTTSLLKTREDLVNIVRLRLPWSAFTPTSDTLETDGNAQEWFLSAVPIQIVAVLLNSESARFGVEGVDGDADFYWNVGEKRFIQEPSAAPLTESDVLVVQFREIGGDVITAQDADSISERQTAEGTSGQYQRMFTAEEGTTEEGGETKAAAILAARNQVNSVLDCVVKTITFNGVVSARPGQLVHLTNIANFGLVDQHYLIDAIDAELSSAEGLTYKIRLLSGEQFLDEIAFFRALAARPTSQRASSATVSPSTTEGGSITNAYEPVEI